MVWTVAACYTRYSTPWERKIYVKDVTPEEAERILREQGKKGEPRPDRVTREEAERIIDKGKTEQE